MPTSREAFRFFREHAGEAADWSWLEYYPRSYREQEHYAEGCVVERRCRCCGKWQRVTSLWGIVDATPEYRRVVEAELFLEAYRMIVMNTRYQQRTPEFACALM